MDTVDGKLKSNRTDPSSVDEWYFQTTTGLIGPLNSSSLEELSKQGIIDGLTYTWKVGMAEWKHIADVVELKKLLLSREELEDWDEGYRATEDEDLEEAKNNDEKTSQPLLVDRTSVASCQIERLPFKDVPSEYKYITPEGIGHVYDISTSTWMTFKQYQELETEQNLNLPNDMHEIQHTASIGDPLNDEISSHLSLQQSSNRTEVDLISKHERNTEARRRYKERLKEKRKAGVRVKAKVNPNVYVTGLPADVSEEELESVFKRAGIIKIDPDTSKSKIRIYRKENGEANGDALITYHSEASVNLAKKYLDGYALRKDCILKVEQVGSMGRDMRQAQFNFSTKLPFVPAHPKDRQLERKRYLAAKLEEARLLGWSDGVVRNERRSSKIMILRPLWTFNEAMKFPLGHELYKVVSEELQQVMSDWISVKRVTPIERHPKGVVCVKFRTPEDCEAAVTRLDGRDFSILGLLDRHAEMCLDLFNDWESKNSTGALYLGTTGTLPSLDPTEVELLRRVDILAAKGCVNGKEAQADEHQNKKRKMETNQDRKTSIITDHLGRDVLDSFAIQSEVGESSPPKCSSSRLRLADFLVQKPLLIEAYVYDGKTDLKGQILPEPIELRNENGYEQEAEEEREVEEKDLASNAEKKEKENHSMKEGDKKWEEWLIGSDSDDDNDLEIFTEIDDQVQEE